MSSKVQPANESVNQVMTEDNIVDVKDEKSLKPEYQPKGNIPALIMFTLLVGLGNL